MSREAVTASVKALLSALGTAFLLAIAPRIFGAELREGKEPRLVELPVGESVKPGSGRGPLAKITAQEHPTAMRNTSDAAVTELDFLPLNGVVRRAVRLRAVIANRGEETLHDIKVRFEAGDKLIAESSVSSLAPAQSRATHATWIPAQPGETRITVTVDPANRLRDIDRSNNIRLRTIQIRPPSVRAAIDPNPLEVTRGEEAKFVAKLALPSARAGDASLIHRWRGPAGRTGQDAVFNIDTSDLQPGKYDVTLEVTDRLGLKNRAQALLTIKQAPRAEVWLTTPVGQAATGETLRFSGGTRPVLSDAQYKFIFADGKETEWSSQAEAQHEYQEAGGYSVQLIARRAGLMLGQASQKINVTETAYTVTLKHDRAKPRAGEPLTFSAGVTPTAGNFAYQFDFGDKHLTAWSPKPAATHSYARAGTYRVRAAIRVKTGRVVQSAAARIRVNPAAASWWPLLAIGAAMLAGAGLVYRRWRLR
jgi:hypothetical protein